MKIRKGSKGILWQELIVVSLVMLFLTLITVMGVGIEKIQAEKAFSEYSKNSFVIISNDLTKLLVVKKDSVYASYWDIEGKEDPVLIWEKKLPSYSPEKAYIRGNALHLQNKDTLQDITIGNVYTHSYYARINNDVYINRVEDNSFVNKIELPDLFASGKWEAVIEISNDNSKIAVFMRYDGLEQKYRNKNYFYLYDINSGEKIDSRKVFGDSDSITNDPHIMGSFSFDGRYITIQHSKNSALHANIYSLEKGRYVFNDKITYGSGELKEYFFLKEKDLLWIRNTNKKHIEIVDLSKGISGEVIKSFNYYSIDGFPRMETDFLGSTYDGNTFNELIAMGDQLVKYKTHQIDDEVIKRIAYNSEKEEWLIVGQSKVHRISSNASNARDSIEQYEEGLKLLEIGFTEGVDKVKGALAKGMFTGLAQNSGCFLNSDYGLSLKERAELVLAEYNCLMAGESKGKIGIYYQLEPVTATSNIGYKITSISDYSDLNRYPEIKDGSVITAVNGKAIIPDKDLKDYYNLLKPGESITLTISQDGINKDYEIKLAGGMLDNYDLLYAHRKLFEYGLLAARAGYPQFTLQAAEQIRGLELIYPSDLLWDKINNHIILLEAVGIAVRDGSEAGFKHMLDNDGILNDDDNQNYILNVYLNDYSEYFAPLLTDKKKMSYFTEIAEDELPSVQMWDPEKVDFVDLEGHEIAGVEGHTGDSPADGTAGDNSSSESDDLNSEDSNSSDSAGTVLD